MVDPPPAPPSYDMAIGSLSLDSPAAPARSEQLPYAPVDYASQLYADYLAEEDEQPGPLPGSSAAAAPSAAAIRRPRSDPADMEHDFGNLRLTSASPPPGSQPHQAQRQNTLSGRGQSGQYPSPYGGGAPPLRQRSVTDGYTSNRTGDPAASVYSLDSGMGAYAPPPSGQGRGYPVAPNAGGQPAGGPGWGAANQQQYPPSAEYQNPYYSAANDFLGMPQPQQAQPGYPPGGPPQGVQPAGPPGAQQVPSRQASMSNLARTNTSRSTLSLSSISSVPPRMPTESVGASSTRRRGGAVAIDVSKPPYTREFVDDYRNRMKVDPDPEAQFAFAKYLVEAAKKIGEELAAHDPRAGRKYRDSLLAESLRNVKKLAEGSKEPYADAQFFLANLYGTGQLGLQVDHEKAYYLYLLASKLNHPAATYRAAVCCELGAGTKRDPNRSVLFYRKAAALGDTAAMYKLALILLNGIMGHPRNPREALVWLRRAAAQADEDNPHALHELALLHERPNNGTNGVIPHDPHLAREYLTQAAQLGYAPAQFKLGQCHEFGTLGFVIDPRRSIAWYTRAAERGDAEAELALSGWYLTGSEGVLKQSDTEAYLWGRKAANKGLAKAEYAVGCECGQRRSNVEFQLIFSDYTEIGIGVKQDIELAKRWYMRAASE